MVHLTNEVTKMIAEWKANGFNGVHFSECYMEKNERVPDEQTQEEYDRWIENYAIFVVSPDLFVEDFNTPNQYVDVEVNTHKFTEDLTKEIVRRLGEDVEIKHYPNCGEFEVERHQKT